jgi:hypothetical protein
MGSGKSELEVVSPVKAVNLHGKHTASITDNKPMINIKPFGKCKSLANPIVAAATAAASGKLQEMPCIPNTIAPWMPGKMNVLAKGQPALMDDCKCMCMWAGIIGITDAGQKTVKNGTAAGAFEQRQAASGNSQPSQKTVAGSEDKKPAMENKKPATLAGKKILMTAGIDMLIGNASQKAKAGKSSQSTETDATEQEKAHKTEQEKTHKIEQEKTYKKGDNGKVILEVNVRLSGFGGMLPTEEFTDLTETGVKQFQKDYMRISEPTGVVDNDTLKAIDEFSEKWNESISDYKCLCHASGSAVKPNDRCSGYGKGEINEKPGIHRSLLWGISALKYYLSQQAEYKYANISAGYRCNAHNKVKNRTSINHMGSAVDIQFKYNNGTLYIGRSKIDKLKKIRDDFFIKYLHAVEGWEGRANSYRLEPIGTGKDESYSWIHIDVVKFEDKYKKDEFFVKEQSSVKGKTLLEVC